MTVVSSAAQERRRSGTGVSSVSERKLPPPELPCAHRCFVEGNSGAVGGEGMEEDGKRGEWEEGEGREEGGRCEGRMSPEEWSQFLNQGLCVWCGWVCG